MVYNLNCDSVKFLSICKINKTKLFTERNELKEKKKNLPENPHQVNTAKELGFDQILTLPSTSSTKAYK